MGRWHAVLSLFLLASSFSALAQEAGSGDPRERKKEAQALAEQGPSAIPRLQALLRDPELEVRLEAVKSIVKVGRVESLDPLAEATRDNDPEIQVRATDGLVNFYLPGYVETGLTASVRRVGAGIKGKFTDTNDQVIPAYIEVRPEIVQALVKLARGGSSMESRANAARALGVLRGRAALPDLVQALRSNDHQVLYECLIAFQKIGDPTVASSFNYLLRDPIQKVQIAAIETAGLLQNHEVLPDLVKILETSKRASVRRSALYAIARMPGEANRGLYFRYLEDEDQHFRAAACEGLGRLRNAEDLPRLQSAFEREGKMLPRLALAFALVLLGMKEQAEFSPLQYVVNTLNSGSYQFVARAYLTELSRDSHVLQVLNRMAPSGTKQEKIHLAQVLAVSGDESSLPPLEALSSDSQPEVAQAALTALQTLKSRLL